MDTDKVAVEEARRIAQHERIKGQLDPKNVLNPGRFVAGI